MIFVSFTSIGNRVCCWRKHQVMIYQRKTVRAEVIKIISCDMFFRPPAMMLIPILLSIAILECLATEYSKEPLNCSLQIRPLFIQTHSFVFSLDKNPNWC